MHAARPSPARRLFLSLLGSAITILAVRDIGHLLESGLVPRLLSAGVNALVEVGGATRNFVRTVLQNFRAAGKAWQTLREAGALEMVTEFGGLRVLRPRSMGEFAQAFRVSQAQVAGEELVGVISASGGSTKRAESVLGRLESAAGKGLKPNPTKAPTVQEAEAARAYRDVARYAAGLPAKQIDAFLAEVEGTLNRSRRPVAELAPLLRAAVKQANPTAFLGHVEWLANTKLTRESFGIMAAKVARGSLDLPWLRTTTLSAEDLEFLARDPKTPWNLFRDAAQNPTNLKLLLRARARARGAAAELLAGETAETLVPGFRVEARQVEMRDPRRPNVRASEIDYQLIATDRTGRRLPMEVKGWTPDKWTESLNALELKSAGKTLKGDAKIAFERIDHMFDQLRDAAKASRREGSVLAITKGIDPNDLKRLKAAIGSRVKGQVQIVTMSEEEILNTSRRLRAGLGIQ